MGLTTQGPADRVLLKLTRPPRLPLGWISVNGASSFSGSPGFGHTIQVRPPHEKEEAFVLLLGVVTIVLQDNLLNLAAFVLKQERDNLLGFEIGVKRDLMAMTVLWGCSLQVSLGENGWPQPLRVLPRGEMEDLPPASPSRCLPAQGQLPLCHCHNLLLGTSAVPRLSANTLCRSEACTPLFLCARA
ncbi:hypothetical protein Salat_2123700 [Sesamum alatum]|uniref:Uncharacterized protein n=1 Tax=Sesamum alatum TaxID=300844 RepID=A0AAE2CGU2_9LAMI|nr:hypothetical protein Salat_2123700 [Sesamum alatum]